jgi:phosphohistidine phosphatase
VPARRFYLVRHAKAEKHAAAGDAARRLTDGGRRAFAAHARALTGEARIARILTSPYARARETAALLAEATGAPVEVEPRLASGALDGRAVLALGAAAGAGVALVGHNPEMAEAIALAGDEDAEVPPGTVAAVRLDRTLDWVKVPERR